MAGLVESFVQQVYSELGLTGALPEKKKGSKDNDPNIWIGSRPQNFAGGQSVVDREVLPLSSMIQKVMSAGGRRDPGYFALADKLVGSNFMTKGSAMYPEGVAGGLANAAAVHQAYAADGGKMNFTQWLDWYSSNSEPAKGPGGRGGRASAYTGPVESVSVAAETDIIAMAQATAQEILGRTASEQEIEKIIKRTRAAEQAEPTVQTRQGPGRVTTEEGLTKEGRDAILNKVLMNSPDYASYQFDSTVMDMMVNNLRRGQEVARGTF